MASPNQIPQISPEGDVPHLHLVPAIEEQAGQDIGINERIADHLQTLDTFVPEDPEAAARVMDKFSELNDHVQGLASKNGTLNGEAIDPELAEALDETVKQGTDYWRLNEDERGDMMAAVFAKTPEELAEVSPKQESLLRNQKPAAGPITQAELQDFQLSLGKRLVLDQELAATKQSDKLATKDDETVNAEIVEESQDHKPAREEDIVDAEIVEDEDKPSLKAGATTEVALRDKKEVEAFGTPFDVQDPHIEQRVYRNGAKHVYSRDEEGKLHHLSHDAILEAYGYDPKSAEYRKALKENQALKGTPEADEAFWSSLSDSERAMWADLTPEERQNLREAKGAATGKEVERYTGPELEVYEPVVDESPKGLRNRYKRLRDKANLMLRTLTVDLKDLRHPVEFYRDKETRKRRIISTVVGAGALIGAGVGIFYAVKSGGDASHYLPNGNHHPKGGGTGPAVHHHVPQHQPHQPAVKPVEHLAHYNQVTGAGTVDYATAEHLHKLGFHFNEAQHEAVMRKVLNYNHITDPRHLQPGYAVHFPGREVMAKWLEESND